MPTIEQAMQMVEEFHCFFNLTPSVETRAKLIEEEVGEMLEELAAPAVDRVRLAKELADVLYVVLGAAVEHGIPLGDVFYAVHLSNMTKTGVVVNGKQLKGDHYVPPTAAIQMILLAADKT